MKLVNSRSVIIALAYMAVACNQAIAWQAAPAAPQTLWNFLGIPKGAIGKMRDNRLNSSGNRPNRERKPPLKAIADPANLESKNPAIAKAAEVKAQEDLAPQKIKAIKYLATIGCNKGYPEVKDVLIAALDDPTEEVRYQAALAIEDTVNEHCGHCNSSCCCGEDLTKVLSKIAYEKNDQGCWIEISERVREAAKRAMCACCPGQGPISSEPQERPESPPANIPEGAPTPAIPLPEEDRSAGREQGARPIAVVDAWVRPSSARESLRQSARGAVLEHDPDAPPASSRTRPSKISSGAAPGRNLKLKQPTALLHGRPQPTGNPLQGPSRDTSPVDVSAVVYVSDSADAAKSSLAPAMPLPHGKRAVPRRQQAVKGTVARINIDAGTVGVRIAPGSNLNVGDRLKVKHPYLLTVSALGYLEVTALGPKEATTRPVDGLKLDKIARGDEAVLESQPARSLGRKIQSTSSTGSPDLATSKAGTKR